MKIVLRKENNFEVKQCPQLKPVDTRPVLGAQLFAEAEPNVFIVARKKSGKSTIIWNIIKHRANKHTKIIAFCSTLYKDDVWYALRKFCDVNDIPFEGHESIEEDGVNHIEDLVIQLAEEAKLRERREALGKTKKHCSILADSDSSSDEEDDKPSKYRVPEYILIFDDLSTELKNKYLTALLKKNRHYKIMTIISSQYIHDMKKEALKMVDYWLILKGMPSDKIEYIAKNADLSVGADELEKIYKIATKPIAGDEYPFLYIDKLTNTYGRNFNIKFDLVEQI